MDITCVIIDDEANNVENLKGLLEKWCPGVNVAACAGSADKGIEAIRATTPDVVFLDIQMPQKSGFEVLKAFETVTFEVVFITAFDQYGIQAIKFSALDYLLKPIDIEELKKAVEKAKARIAARQQNQNIGNLLSFIKNTQQDVPKIALPTMSETRYVKVSEIIRCEAYNNYTTFFLPQGEEVLVCKTLKEFAELLKPYGFERTHQSHLVNIKYVKSLLKEDGGKLLMEDRSKIPISRQNLDKIKKTLSGIN
ncbi:LytR/AlgR family response regulator transcription factor [Mucilaginibacter calamicampi]|uniref:LytR/AlgR family response regulator transcription factor n=1 Tax=Mucilaginibacter calamicampi TaxID=1302352 RepID=A0ABW2YUF9_9SPHI